MRDRSVFFATCLTLSLSVVAPATAEAAETTASKIDSEWHSFVHNRGRYLEALAKPLVACAEKTSKKNRRRGKRSPYTTCTARDWQSRVQSAHALLSMHRVTGDQSYADTAELAFDKRTRQNIRRLVEQGDVARNPYEYVWFLAAARERELATAQSDLRGLAHEVATALDTWVASLDDTEMARGVVMGSPKSVAWAVQNLSQWAVLTGDKALGSRMRTFTKKRLLSAKIDEWCSASIDQQPEVYELFPPFLHRVLAVMTVIPGKKTDAWLAGVLPREFDLDPLNAPAWSTHAGLNFSRSWGLWALYEATGQAKYRQMYVDHIEAQMNNPDVWSSFDDARDPWVAQFGVYAIGLSYGENDVAVRRAIFGGAAAAPSDNR